ncbi:hypothetical protein EsH8_II_000047 [Colletotrichum jinshuiense]
MDETTEMSSISKFFADYTSRSGIPFLELLADVYVAGPPPWLSDAMHAAAMASASRQLRQAGLMTRARQAYGEAVKGINGAIQDEALVNEDSVLIAVFVLGLFQLMDFFMTPGRIPSLWFETDAFINSLASRPRFEPLIRRAVDFKIHFVFLSLGPCNLVPSSQESGRVPDIPGPEIIRCGLSLAQDLEAAAEEIDYINNFHIGLAAFNNLITISSATNASIAKCLYLTVRLYIMEMVLAVADTYHLNSCLAQPNTLTYIEPLLKEIETALGGIRSQAEAPIQGEPGMGSRAYLLFWPMMAVLCSTSASKSSQAWVQEKLLEAGTAHGFGLAATASKGR